jgi:hypothetical protein
MNDILISMGLALVLGLVLVAVLVRNHYVKDFKLNKRARTFAEYVADTMVKQPRLRDSHGFYVQPELLSRVAAALKFHLFRRAVVTHTESQISIVYNNTTWTIPVCTDSEYIKHYI